MAVKGNATYRRGLQLTLREQHRQAVVRLAEVPGSGGCPAAVFPSGKQLAAWAGVCPGVAESAGGSRSTGSPKGNKPMRRCRPLPIFEATFVMLRRTMPDKKAIWAMAHRSCLLVWKLPQLGVSYEERGLAVQARARRSRTNRMIGDLRNPGHSLLKPGGGATLSPD
jgi:hypothetical protein